jgi:pyruvate ferredoxin oxidoreductase gamma subunit
MIEIRIHGKGGQGAVTAAEVLAIAAFHDGKFSQAFPSFGPERSGAPVEAYCRIYDKFINLRTHIYEPDYLLVLDSSLIKAIDVTKGLKKNGVIVINSAEKIKSKFSSFNINATKIALEVLGKPIVNTAMLGAFAKATKLITMKSLKKALKEKFSGDLLEKNIHAVRKAYDEMKI